LVHEAYLRLVASEKPGFSKKPGFWVSRNHFFAAAATAMRHILVDNARRKKSSKREGQLIRQRLEEVAAPLPNEELLVLDEALQRLAATEPEKAKLVELRYFAGLTGEQAAEILGIAKSTADRHWAYARAWLQAEVRGGG
jgi:RNA polymerase sigma factor (TIGR02999 family)